MKKILKKIYIYMFNFYRKIRHYIKIVLLNIYKNTFFRVWVRVFSQDLEIRVDELFMQQNADCGYTRLDIIIRYLAIEEYYGKNKIGFSLYEKLQRICFDDQEAKNANNRFKDLIKSWDVGGYDKNSLVLLDKNLMLVDGSHRIALALYHNLEYINCRIRPFCEVFKMDVPYLMAGGFTVDEIKIITEKYEAVYNKIQKPISAIIWPSAYEFSNEILEKISYLYKVRNIRTQSFTKSNFALFLRSVYYIDDVENWKIEEKLSHINDNDKFEVVMFNIFIDNPKFRIKKGTSNTISGEGELIKKTIRSCYSKLVKNYCYDIILHTGDNYLQSEFINSICEQAFSLKGCFDAISKTKYVVIKLFTNDLDPNFPENYILGKDIDLVCSEDDIDTVRILLNDYLCDNVKKGFSIKEEYISKDHFFVRVELQGCLIMHFDVETAKYKYEETFLKEMFENRILYKGVYIPCIKDELVFRCYEYIEFPNKEKHIDYILKNSDYWNYEYIKKSIISCEERDILRINEEVIV